MRTRSRLLVAVASVVAGIVVVALTGWGVAAGVRLAREYAVAGMRDLAGVLATTTPPQPSASGPDPIVTKEVTAAEAAARRVPGVASVARAVSQLGPDPEPGTAMPAPQYLWNLAVTMTPAATSAETAQVIDVMKSRIGNTGVNVLLGVPAGAGHASWMLNLQQTFDTDVLDTTVASTTSALNAIARVPGVQNVALTVPYTWNLDAGDLRTSLDPDTPATEGAVRSAVAAGILAQTPLGF
jgi:hypothetical protein